MTPDFTTRAGTPYYGKDSTIVVAESNVFGRIVRHLELLKQALESQNVIAHVTSTGGSRVTMQIADLQGDVTCRSNPADAHHLWFWHKNESITPAGGNTEARIAAAKLLELRTRALAAGRQ